MGKLLALEILEILLLSMACSMLGVTQYFHALQTFFNVWTTSFQVQKALMTSLGDKIDCCEPQYGLGLCLCVWVEKAQRYTITGVERCMERMTRSSGGNECFVLEELGYEVLRVLFL